MYLRRTRVSTASRSWFVTARIAAGIPQMTIHDLRHTAASLAVSAGANVKAIQRMLGHASAAMTLDIYADLFDDDLDDVSARLDDAAAKSVVGFLWGMGKSGHKKPPESLSFRGSRSAGLSKVAENQRNPRVLKLIIPWGEENNPRTGVA
jgi:hypothetical protein